MIKEHDCVVLTTDIPANGLEAGDMGTVIHIHANGAGYEVEVVTLSPDQLRPIHPRDLPHARELPAAVS